MLLLQGWVQKGNTQAKELTGTLFFFFINTVHQLCAAVKHPPITTNLCQICHVQNLGNKHCLVKVKEILIFKLYLGILDILDIYPSSQWKKSTIPALFTNTFC